LYLYGSLDILGHIDASETKGRDRDLGTRRAANVRDFLIQIGISGDIMTTRDFGAKRLLVPTDAGKPEPQNRYVDFRYAGFGSLEQVAAREDCIKWLQNTFCKPLGNARDAEACTNAIKSL